jgi:hypothetical protein
MWARDPGTVVIGFRGTQGQQMLNWKLNLASRKVPAMFKGFPGLQHKGFLLAFYVQVMMLQHTKDAKRFDLIMHMLEKRVGEILVVGHSLGGATAANMAAWLYSHPKVDSKKVFHFFFVFRFQIWIVFDSFLSNSGLAVYLWCAANWNETFYPTYG